MILGAVIPKLIGINNYQTRAISLETGLRNASLAMALSLLIQDYMGDFYSSMFFTSAIFGLWMYVADSSRSRFTRSCFRCSRGPITSSGGGRGY